ncbi:MAG: hypothetical protein EP320_12030 [Rhodobacteraceae bacterium]|nr:MAG: hypothetical protein EP320_12030 [Paracoccaceae bacterium]
MRRVFMGLAVVLHAALPAWAQTDLTALSDAERRAFGAEIRAYLHAHPQVIGDALSRLSAPSYAEAAASDKALISRHADALFGAGLPGFGAADAPVTLALFTASDCAACRAAEADLRALAETQPIRVTLIDDPDLAARLDLDLLPAYVFSDMMVRGHVPPVVLEGYIANR